LWSVTSDQRLKKNIVDHKEGLSKITQLKVRNFKYRLPEEITELDSSNAINIQGVQLGLIAQELAEDIARLRQNRINWRYVS
jgi:phage gp45-like